MYARALIPIEVEAEPTPMGRKPFSRWVQAGAGGGPYEPRGFYPAAGGGARRSVGYDGLGPARAQVGMGTARRFVGLDTRLRGLAQDEELAPEPAQAGMGPTGLFLILGAAVGAAAAYIAYDETAGTGARLRRRRF